MTGFKEVRDLLLSFRGDRKSACRHFRWPTLDRFNWALDWFDAQLSLGPLADDPALMIVGGNAAVVSFAELSRRSNRLANGLRAMGVRRGDIILLMLDNRTALWETMLAAMKLGAITAPATTLLTHDDLVSRLSLSRARVWITSDELARKFDHAMTSAARVAVGEEVPGWMRFDDLLESADTFSPDHHTGADDPILLYFTSGTTARPKLVMHSHRSYGIGSLSTMYWLGLRPGDRHLNVSSPGWAKHAWSCFFAPWNAGATVFVPNFGRFEAQALLNAIAEHRMTSLCAPPTVWRMLIQENLSEYATTLQSVCGAGEPLNPEVIEVVERAWGLSIRDGYGQTETTAQIGNTPGERVRPGSVGQALPGYDVVLLDGEGNECHEGEIALALSNRPAGLMCGYLREDGSIDSVGGDYYRTGDLASRDADGYFTYIGRADDVFKASDYRISPFELESALIEHEAITETAVVPAPDPIRSAIPKAYVVLAPGYEPSRQTALQIFRHVRSALAPYKRVRRIEFADLPKTISGKIRRVELRMTEMERARAGIQGALEFREEDFPELRGAE